ncbi:hypothetical protein [Candidatus Magnetaquicoccus inordinatus]|uniref:hypothetical protein n=1 Tax=Candidatus Magnetaquicoccus inordinatus TaxID=2496818 RepID=UPI00102B94F8|nr:hypothetical protein [Candidatus Magnetaquicoccus inordinatus]
MPPYSPQRRRFLWQTLLSTLALASKGNASDWQQGIRRLQGELLVDGEAVAAGARIAPGSTVQSGAESRTVLVMGADAYLIGAHTSLTFHPSTNALPQQSSGFTLHSGRILSVFASGKKQLQLPSIHIGIRGTGIFVQAEPLGDYLCLCYGKADIAVQNAANYQEFLDSKHHTARLLETGKPLRPGALINHSDEELFMLEALTGRLPSFSDSHY